MIGTQPAAPPHPWRPRWAVLGSGIATQPGPAPCPGVVWTEAVRIPPTTGRMGRAWQPCSRALDHPDRCLP